LTTKPGVLFTVIGDLPNRVASVVIAACVASLGE
jgi:hypothetical protein